MIVYAYAADLYGCGWHRILYPAGVLQAQGHDVRVICAGDETHISATLKYDQVVGASGPPDADVIVLQRPTNRKLAQCIPFLRDQGIAVVVDMDDDLAHIHPKNPSFAGLHPSNPNVNWHHAAQACRDATFVTVSTPVLAQVYGSHGRVRVLENCVPASTLEIERIDADWIGWPGSLHSHPDDLGEMAAAVERLVREGGEFRVVGDGVGVARELGLTGGVPQTGSIRFGDWSEAVSKVGVGVSPLKDTRFNAAKSWLKPLHLAACGVPWVASDLPEYRRLAEMGAGVVVHRRNWYRELRRLTGSSAARDEASAAGREVVADWTYEGLAWRWMEAWEDARKCDTIVS